MAHNGLPNKKIRCMRTTMMARSTSSHVRPDRLARTTMKIPFEFPCNARPVHRYGAWIVFALVFLASIGLPLSGEAILVSAAIFARTTQTLASSLFGSPPC